MRRLVRVFIGRTSLTTLFLMSRLIVFIFMQIAHLTSAALTDQDFQVKWNEASNVIKRLGASIPNIDTIIDNSLQLSIDPEKENEYIDKWKQWEDLENRMTRLEGELKSCKEELIYCREDIGNIRKEFSENKTQIESSISSEFRSLLSRSQVFFDEEHIEFVETSTYKKAEKILKLKKIVILTGHPGEGKTAMAKYLLRDYPHDSCVNLREPADYKSIDFSSKRVKAILIDDIFGSSVLDQNIFKQWERKLDELPNLAKTYEIDFVITSRNYIIEEVKQLFRSVPLFAKENIQLLSSKDLTVEEKKKILEAHLKAKERKIQANEINSCVEGDPKDSGHFLAKPKEFPIGFPECVYLFTRQDDLFNKGSEFFSRPENFAKECIHQLYRDEDKSMALTVMWANTGHTIDKSKLDTNHIRVIAETFQFKRSNFNKLLRKSLDCHVGGFLHFSPETGTYSFNHDVIADMVGLVIANEYPDEVLGFCTRGFLLTYVTALQTEASEEEFKHHVEEYRYEKLADRFIGFMIEEKISKEGIRDCSISLPFNRGVQIPENIDIDFSIIKHDAFKNVKFVDKFLEIVKKKGYLQKLFAHEIMEMSGFFLSYGIKIKEQKYFILSYSVYIGADKLAQRLLGQTPLPRDEVVTEYTIATLFAIHHQNSVLLKALLAMGAIVTEAALYIAAHKKDMNILELLMKQRTDQKLRKLERGGVNIEIVNGNNGLIVAAKKGFDCAVRCFIENGYDLTARNKDGLSALDKAIAFKHERTCELLIKEGADHDTPTRKFKKTPLHTAVDLGLTAVTKCLLDVGTKLATKDRRGHYPIHTAALNKHYDIVHALLEHDIGQATFRIKQYDKRSDFRGRTVFHIALLKKDYRLLSLLLTTNANPNVTDWYGRTVLFESIMSGEKTFINKLIGVADLTIPNKNGFTPLHAAVCKDYIEVVHTLCSHPSVNVNAKDSRGVTPLLLAAVKGNSKIFLALSFLYNADWRMITNKGDNIMEIVLNRWIALVPHDLEEICTLLADAPESIQKDFSDTAAAAEIPAHGNKARNETKVSTSIERPLIAEDVQDFQYGEIETTIRSLEKSETTTDRDSGTKEKIGLNYDSVPSDIQTDIIEVLNETVDRAITLNERYKIINSLVSDDIQNTDGNVTHTASYTSETDEQLLSIPEEHRELVTGYKSIFNVLYSFDKDFWKRKQLHK